MKITITNPFHGTATTVENHDGVISVDDYYRARKELCPLSGCSCLSFGASGDARKIAGAIPVGSGYQLAD